MNFDSPVTDIPKVGPSYAIKLNHLGIKTVSDLLWYIPTRYIDFQKKLPISNARVDDVVTVQGELVFIKNQFTKRGKRVQIGEIKDRSGSMMVVFFNQPFLVRTFFPGDRISFSGKVSFFGRSKAIISPDWEKGDNNLHTGRLVPVYAETKGISSKYLRSIIRNTLSEIESSFKEYLNESEKQKYNLIEIKDSFFSIHFPLTMEDAIKARERLSFDELVTIHLESIKRKKEWEKNESTHKIQNTSKYFKEYKKLLSFELTEAQVKTIKEILIDLEQTKPMNRLLEGDVGSGKTVVAGAAIYSALKEKLQVVVMAPTQILANQHFNTLTTIFKPLGISISLLTSATPKTKVANTDIVIGTHALIHRNISLDNVALVVIDEQHKFGVEQRAHLVRKVKNKSISPHVLTMTATPIPRTVALTYYGDIDLSVIDEMPPGRMPPETWIVKKNKRDGAYKWIEEEIQNNQTQVYVICPLIEESEDLLLNVKAVKNEFEEITNLFPRRKVGLLHGKMSLKEKIEVIDNFNQHKIDILVSTPVIEVGIDVANANIMIIETAERFGLAQLHQLRGRIGRGSKKSYCLLFYESLSEYSKQRLEAFKNESSGFKLSELDLTMRGPGEIFGKRQHGLPELKIASWQDIAIIRSTKILAEQISQAPERVQNFLESTGKMFLKS